MKIDRDCDFMSVYDESGDELDAPCSPVSEPTDREGVWLNAPRVARLQSAPVHPLQKVHANVMICGAWRLSYESLNQHVPFTEGQFQVTSSVNVMAVDLVSHQAYACSWLDEMGAPVVPPPEGWPDRPAPDARLIRGGYFNLNLAHWMRLPLVPAKYVVYAALGPFRSSPLTIAVEDPDRLEGKLPSPPEPRVVELQEEIDVVGAAERALVAGVRADPAGTGVVLAVPPQVAAGQAFVIQGWFQVPASAEPHKDLLLAMSGPTFAAASPFRSQVLFPDDREAVADKVRGGFQLQVRPKRRLPPGTYFLTVSVGEQMSAVYPLQVS